MNTLVDSNQQHKCLSALRKLLLPLSDKQELLALSAALKAAADIGIDPIDFPIFLNREQVQWQRSGAPSEELDRIVTAALSLQDDHAGKKIGRIYFPLHRDFREKTDLLLSFRDATMTLSHARLIYNLSINSNLTASQIARIVNTRDPRLNSNRKIISRLMVKLGIQHELDEVLVLNLFDSDSQDSL